jgi:hypothetical protein
MFIEVPGVVLLVVDVPVVCEIAEKATKSKAISEIVFLIKVS